MKGGCKENRDSNEWICWGYLGSFCRITFVLKSFEFPFCFFFFIVFLMFIWTALNRNTLRYVQLSQERHMIQGANVPGTAVQLQWSGAGFRAKEAPLSNLNFFVKNCWNFCWFFENFCKFCQNFADFLLNFDQSFSGFFQNAAIFTLHTFLFFNVISLKLSS